MKRIRAICRWLCWKFGWGSMPADGLPGFHATPPPPKPDARPVDHKACCVYHVSAGKDYPLDELIQSNARCMGTLNADPLKVGDTLFAPRLAQMTCATVTPVGQPGGTIWQVTLLAEIRLRGWDFFVNDDGDIRRFEAYRTESWPTPAPWTLIDKEPATE